MKLIQRKLRRKRRRNNKRGRRDVAPFFIKNMLLRKTKYWKLLKRLESLKDGSVVDDAIEDNLYEIVKLNQSQLEKGEYVSGSELPDYSDLSIEFYGKPDGPMTLKGTGYYYGSMEAELSSDKELILLDSDPIKKDRKGKILNIETIYGTDYGQEIKGLQDKNKKVIQEKIRINTIKRVKNILFKGL